MLSPGPYDPESCSSGEKKISRQEAPSRCTQLGLLGGSREEEEQSFRSSLRH